MAKGVGYDPAMDSGVRSAGAANSSKRVGNGLKTHNGTAKLYYKSVLKHYCSTYRELPLGVFPGWAASLA